MAGTIWTTRWGKRVQIVVMGGKTYYFNEHGQRLTSKGKLYNMRRKR